MSSGERKRKFMVGGALKGRVPAEASGASVDDERRNGHRRHKHRTEQRQRHGRE
ncbi:Protein AF-17 [Clarias magur]|uniref:Protein AF-17 n=1 Tax=Clarias magur TaxID=1594786 RepID=A0A8J4XAC7_CLAMG|nr:Protein AF-17 [Clarias magur]